MAARTSAATSVEAQAAATHTHAQTQAQTQTHTTTVRTYEILLYGALQESNKIAKSDLSGPINENDVEMTHQIATAKMLNYCIRMLHADGWHPPTIVRAMALRESGLDRGMRGTMLQALHERRKELEMYRRRRAGGGGSGSGTGAGTDPDNGVDKLSPKSSGGGSGNDHRGGGTGHGVGGATKRGFYGHGHERGTVRSHANTHPRHPAPIGGNANSDVGAGPDSTTTSNTNRPFRTDPVIANGAVSRNSGMVQASKDREAVSLI